MTYCRHLSRLDTDHGRRSKHDIQTERRLEVDLSRDPERAVGGRPDKVFVVIKPASTRVHVNLGSIYDYMNGRCLWGADVIKAISEWQHSPPNILLALLSNLRSSRPCASATAL